MTRGSACLRSRKESRVAHRFLTLVRLIVAAPAHVALGPMHRAADRKREVRHHALAKLTRKDTPRRPQARVSSDPQLLLERLGV